MLSTVGQAERRTQQRVVDLFRQQLGYEYLGNWSKRAGNANIELGLLRSWLTKQHVADNLVGRALYIFGQAAGDTGKSLYDRNHEVYDLLRYGVKVKPEAGEITETVWLIDWKNPENNSFAIAEEVAVAATDPAAYGKRPDMVLYVNGIALGVLELKRSTVSVAEGIRQNLDNQSKTFIEHFFSTVQWVMAGNDTEGLRYGTVSTKEKYYLSWKEDDPEENPLDRGLRQLCSKARLLELIHDFIVFDAGTKKLCRHNQYFGVRAAQEYVRRHEGGIIWHTQGSGKSLTMVWLARWIAEHVTNARVLIITDRTELDEQIEKVFTGVKEDIIRAKNGAELVAMLNATTPRLLCSLIHKFGGKDDDEEKPADVAGYLADLKKMLPLNFAPKGNLYVFVDECHRTQSGVLHDAMKAILPDAVFIGFTGTPLLKADKQRSIETFGRYIHTYKFDEAVSDGVVLDLRYEARDIDQYIKSQAKIDQWFEVKTKGLTDLARAQLKQRWGTMQTVLSSQSRLEMIADDILMDMETRDRLASGRGNAMLVSSSIYQACRFFELFARTDLKGKCAIITSYKPSPSDIKGEDSGEGLTERLRQYDIYRQMLADWFHEPPESAMNKVEAFETAVKKKFIDEPGQMKLLIVVDKLLTGFDAPPATYLYIDKQMRDHGLFQAICRVNRLDDDKQYGYIIDYKDLFKSLEGAVQDYTSGALDGYDEADVAGLLADRLGKAREQLEEAQETVRALCEAVEAPRDTLAYIRYFCANDAGSADQLKDNESRRLALYRHVSAFVRAYAGVANELQQAGFSEAEGAALKAEVTHYESVRNEVKQASGDAIDLKQYEPAMRHLIDTYIRAEESTKVSAFDDLTLVKLIVERGQEAIEALPKAIRESKEAVAETIVNNVRRLIVDETPINPKYYERMSELLDALIEQRKQGALDYQQYLEEIVALAKQAANPGTSLSYPAAVDTPARRALFDNLDRDEMLALAVDGAVYASKQDAWRESRTKIRQVRLAIKLVLGDDEQLVDRILDLVKNQHEY